MLRAGSWLANRTAGQISSACSYFLIGLRPDSVGGQQSHKTADKNNLLQKERGAEYRKCSGWRHLRDIPKEHCRKRETVNWDKGCSCIIMTFFTRQCIKAVVRLEVSFIM